jgi:hypothetical protein
MKIIRRQYVTLLETLIAVAWTTLILSTLSYFYSQIDSLNNQTEELQRQSFKLRYVESRLAKILPNVVALNKAKKDFYFFTVSDASGLFKPGSPGTLFFTYDNGVDLNKSLSSYVLGRLYLDEQGRFCLATWPAPSNWVEGVNPPMKNEVLLEGVESLKISFFVPPNKNWKGINPENEVREETMATEPVSPNPQPALKPRRSNTKKDTPPDPSSTATNASSHLKGTRKPDQEGAWVQDWSQEYKLLPGFVKIEIVRNKEKEIYVFPISSTQRQIVYNQ